MQKYPELLKLPESAERFYNEFKEVLPKDKFFTDFIFVNYCDDFQWAFNKYLLTEQSSLYSLNTQVRTYFLDNQGHIKRLALYAIFIKEFLDETEEMLLEKEYYELMRRYKETREKVQNLVNLLMSDSF